MKIKIAVFDIETPLSKWDSFSGYNQYLSIKQLDPAYKFFDVISIHWIDSEERKVKHLHWGFKGESTEEMCAQFDAVIKYYQDRGFVIWGKNNNRFDNKKMNLMRVLHNNEPMPEWTQYVEDLESHMRANFGPISQKLDHWSDILGFGGKNDMELSDWQWIGRAKMYWRCHEAISNIIKTRRLATAVMAAISPIFLGCSAVDIRKLGKERLIKMVEYGDKDAVDTLKIIEKLRPHFKAIKNKLSNTRTLSSGASYKHLRCRHCGGDNIRPNGTRGDFQSFWCRDCTMYAGRAIIKKDGTLGVIRRDT